MSNYNPHYRAGIFRLIFCILAAVFALTSSSAQTEQHGSIDWIFVLDTSRSMRGEVPGSTDIFEPVKKSINKFIEEGNVGDTITLYTFDSKINLWQDRQVIKSPVDKDNLIRIVNLIQAQGDYTHTGEAVSRALEKAAEIKQYNPSSGRAISTLLFTDGQERVRTSDTIRLSSIDPSRISKVSPYVYVIWLNNEPVGEELSRIVKGTGSLGEVITTVDQEEIEGLVNKIRPKLVPPPPREIRLMAGVRELDFGEIEPGNSTERKSIKVNSSLDTLATVSLNNSSVNGVAVAEPQEPVALKAGDNEVNVRLKANTGAPNQESTLSLVVAPESTGEGVIAVPAEISSHLRIHYVPIWQKALKWAALLLAMLLAAITLFSLHRGQFPTEMWSNFVERHNIEGEFEVLRPRPSLDDGMLSLSLYRSNRIRLASLLPDDAVGGSDAELVSVRKDGRKLTQLRSISGSVRVNKVDVASQELYDGDIVDIGNASLRFNSVHERPVNYMEEEY